MENVYQVYGLLANIMSDHVRKLDSHFWRAVFKRLDTMLNLSTTNHPQMDGQTKRVHQVLEDMPWAYVSERQLNWEDYLPILEFAYNSAKHASVRFSPFMLMYGFWPRSHATMGLAKEKIQHVKDSL